MIRGKATSSGTENYVRRFSHLPATHFRKVNKWRMSSLGLGTYLGEPDEATDASYTEAIQWALQSGCNVIDTAINYRHQRSERNAGAALSRAIEKGSVSRDEVVLSTKGGFLSFDGDVPSTPSTYINQEYIQTGICKAEEIVAGCHCMTPLYLENQLERSLRNLNVECVDIYLIHNPETQLGEISRPDFLRRVLAAFQALEKKAEEGKIQVYGVATWNGFREPVAGRSFLSLQELIGLAIEAGGNNHHFRAVQLPYNVAMPEAFLTQNQNFGSQIVSFLQAAEESGMIVLCSASILQGRLSANLPEVFGKFFGDLKNDAQRSIQFVRSTPGVTSALIGMSQRKHVEENLQVARKEPVPWSRFKDFFAL